MVDRLGTSNYKVDVWFAIIYDNNELFWTLDVAGLDALFNNFNWFNCKHLDPFFSGTDESYYIYSILVHWSNLSHQSTQPHFSYSNEKRRSTEKIQAYVQL